MKVELFEELRVLNELTNLIFAVICNHYTHE